MGNGLVAAGAAVTLAHALNAGDCKVIWVSVGTLSQEADQATEVADPAFVRWLTMVGYPEHELLYSCRGLYTLGLQYNNKATDFFFPYGTHGIEPSPAPFEQEFFRRFAGADQLAFANHFLATHMARLGRFDFPVDDPRSAKSTLGYGLHLDRKALVQCLVEYASTLGVECVSCDTLQVHGSRENRIESLSLDNQTLLAGDFFVDATGEPSLLLRQALHEPYECADTTPWRYRVSYREKRQEAHHPFAQMIREPWGWRRRSGLQDNLTVDCWVRDEAALRTLEQAIKPGDYCIETMQSGRSRQSWVGNCLALGKAAGQPGELMYSEWSWASRCLLLWLELLPDRRGRARLRDEYNRRWREMYAVLSEIHWMHAAGVECETENLPEPLQWRLSIFSGFGRLWRRDDEVLSDEAWIVLALGLGWYPQGYDITLTDADMDRLQDKHKKIYRTLVKVAESMPTLATTLKNLKCVNKTP